MTKKQNTMVNYVAILLALVSYIILKTYNDFHYLQIVQKIFLSVLFICGLIVIINNIINLKRASKKLISILLLCFGVVLALYSGFALYLILALQNTGF